MFDKDWDIVNSQLGNITRKSFDEEENFINPYENKKGAQTKCRHMWGNDTDAIYVTVKGRRKCAICGKEM